MSTLAIGIFAWLGGNVLLVPVMWVARIIRDRKRARLLALFRRGLRTYEQRERPHV